MLKRTHLIAHLEIALIELEYAAADFGPRDKGGRYQLDPDELQKLRVKLQAANQAIRIALMILGDPDGLIAAAELEAEAEAEAA